MKSIAKQSNKKTAFTIIELLTVISIIVVIIGLLVPALSKAKKYAYYVKQKAQFHSIDTALEFFNNEWDGYPESTGGFGAVELCEAVMGRDLQGYTPNVNDYNKPDTSGREPYLPLENANAYQLKCLYRNIPLSPVLRDRYVLCDVYRKVRYENPDNPNDSLNGKKVGMPILYYKANTSGTTHPVKYPFYGSPAINNGIPINAPDNIYKFEDNDGLVQLGIPWILSGAAHLMDSRGLQTLRKPPLHISNAYVFYNEIWNDKVAVTFRPYKSNSYILMSAGYNGEYGGDRTTGDDVFNFEN